MKGLGSLNTPTALFEKLEYDRRRLEADPADEYAAFDFFVTAYHMLEWVHPNTARTDAHQANKRRLIMNKERLLTIAAELANGVKHFEQFSYSGVVDVETAGGYWPRGYWPAGYWKPGFWKEPKLIIKLTTAEAAFFGGAPSLVAIDAARKLCTFWKTELGL
jgi:hypothetical protein